MSDYDEGNSIYNPFTKTIMSELDRTAKVNEQAPQWLPIDTIPNERKSFWVLSITNEVTMGDGDLINDEAHTYLKKLYTHWQPINKPKPPSK